MSSQPDERDVRAAPPAFRNALSELIGRPWRRTWLGVEIRSRHMLIV